MMKKRDILFAGAQLYRAIIYFKYYPYICIILTSVGFEHSVCGLGSLRITYILVIIMRT